VLREEVDVKKERKFPNTLFPIAVIAEARTAVLAGEAEHVTMYSVQTDAVTTYKHDTFEDWIPDYGRPFAWASLDIGTPHYDRGLAITVTFDKDTTVQVQAPNREAIERLMGLFEAAAPSSGLPVPKAAAPPLPPPPAVFIGHGNSAAWKLLADHLRDQHGYEVQAYEIGARAGHTIRDILDDLMSRSSFAVLVMIGEDKDATGKVHPRQNVVHELGLFQGRLGFTRAIVLLEEGTEEFSNIHGIQQIRFTNIRETFGDVLATLRREF